MIIEIVRSDATFFRSVTDEHWKSIVKSVPQDGWTGTGNHLERLRKLVWKGSKPAKVSSTISVEATVVDDFNDIESCQESWEENFETLVATCEHKNTFDNRGHLCCHDCGGVDV